MLITTGDRLYSFLTGLKPQLSLPEKVSIINPYHNKEVRNLLKQFCKTFYGNTSTRVLVLGINPGRFGAGVTGISFTDPVALERYCGIQNSFEKKQEFSARFVYDVITAYGGAKKFYEKFLLNALCPLGFLHGIKNHNYYDSPQLIKASAPLIKESLLKFSKMNISRKVVISLGKKNATHLMKFNDELRLFEKVVTLEHPRYIMQYKSKDKERYVREFVEALYLSE